MGMIMAVAVLKMDEAIRTGSDTSSTSMAVGMCVGTI